ncbi:hypothetical protein [Diaphorobacter sp.]|uniref:hypothetical protein n=1 Tax=Diaphorobacter sp. TaxID=1934310 RepID=UPI00289C7111|nr:hypothetical protein [Diaphorobacter sp.]
MARPLLPNRSATAREAIEAGKNLCLLKESAAHGEFAQRCEARGISRSSAARYMALARRFHGAPGDLLTAAGGFGKLAELIALDDDEIESLGRGEEVRGLSLSALERMTVRQVREAVRAGQVLQSAGRAGAAGGSNAPPVVHLQTPSPVRERQADYCRRLGKVITRYLTPDELWAYGEHLEAFAAQVTASRPAQGLHDASYHLRLRFKMPGAGPDGTN